MTSRQDHAARAILQIVAQHIASDPALREQITNLLGDEFVDVARQTMAELKPPDEKGET